MSDPKRIDKAVILARGLGTRMRENAGRADVSDEQDRIADTGVKAMIPIERPFLDYVLAALADAGYHSICLVVGPEHDTLREYYGRTLQPTRVSIDFAVQAKPLGTADAVLAGREFVGGDDFLVLNSDNYYPLASLSALRDVTGWALPGFRREGLLAGNIPPERIARFSVVDVDADGHLRRIVEKPSPAVLAEMPEPIRVSMNLFRFSPTIFEACGRISPSPRNELELPDAVQYGVDALGEQVTVLDFSAPVLDLTSRADIQGVAQRLTHVEVNL